MIFFVVMYLTIYNADTGDMLYTTKQRMAQTLDDPVTALKDCLTKGTVTAYAEAITWRLKFPAAFAQVNCKWEHENASN